MKAQSFRESIFYVTWRILDALTCGWMTHISVKSMELDASWMTKYQLRLKKE